jgi:hypothetical protein
MRKPRLEQIHIRALPEEKKQWPKVVKKAKKFKLHILAFLLKSSEAYQPKL